MRRAMILLVLLSTPALATTVQQDFDAAQALLDAGKAAEARDAFTALLGRFAPNSQGMAANLVRARLGNALLATGDAEAAEPLLATAGSGLTRGDATSIEERGLALFDLGRARENQGKLDSAAKAYQQVRDAKFFTADGPGDIGLRAALARTQIWSNPDEARRLLDGLLALPPAALGTTADTRALLQTLRGRVELNHGNFVEAQRWFQQAAKTAGGATTQSLTVADVRIRGDLALAAFKLNRPGEVQKYVAFSGAGGLQSEGLYAAADMPLPACAPLTGLAQDAVAVVEFGISDDGRVIGATPVYASQGRSGANVADNGPESLFTQAVRQWIWNTASIAKVEPFWRQAVRVELRCFTARPDVDPVSRSFWPAWTTWTESIGIRPLPKMPDSDALALPLLRDELARREREEGAQSVQLIAPLRALAANLSGSNDDRIAAWERLLGLLGTAKPPAAITGTVGIHDARTAASRKTWPAERARLMRDRMTGQIASLVESGNGETRVAYWTRLELAEALDGLKQVPESRDQLDRIIAAPTSSLSDGDPIRTAALLRLSNQAAAAKDLATAASALDATGLSPEQCSLVDVRPQPVAARFYDLDFPDEARRWGTSGFVRFAYDIAADGTTKNIRTVVASPPFIFGPAVESRAARFRYQPVFRPGNTMGCTGSTQNVTFRMLN